MAQNSARGLGRIIGGEVRTNDEGQPVLWLQVLIGESSVNTANPDAKEATAASDKQFIGRTDELTGNEQFVSVRVGSKLARPKAKAGLPGLKF